MLQRIIQFFRRSRLDRAMDDEMRFHLEMETENLIRGGLSPAEARRRARLAFGGVANFQEETREARGLLWLDRIFQDSRYALRTFRKTPFATLGIAVTLALGIGLNLACFSAIYAFVFRPLPVADPGRMVNIHMSTRGDGDRGTYGTPFFVSFAEYGFLRANAKTAEVAGTAEAALTGKGLGDQAVRALMVSDNLLPLIGARPALGRFFRAEECATPGAEPVVVLQHSFWKARLGSDPGVIGTTLVLNRTLFTVIGVTAEGVKGPVVNIPDVWIPLTMQRITRPGEPLIDHANLAFIQLFGRLRPGSSRSGAQAELQVLGQRSLEPHLPKRTATVTVMPGSLFNFPFVFQQGILPLALLATAVGLVLLLACANVANILLARGLARAREMALRLSIGAGRGRIIQQLLTESVLLAMLSGALGALLAAGGGRLVMNFVQPRLGPTTLDLSPDLPLVVLGLLLTLATGVLFGLFPALQTSRVDLTPALRSEGSLTAAHPRRRWLTAALVGLQVAICAVLLINAGLLVRGLGRAVTMDTGVARNDVLIAYFDLRQQQYTPERARLFFDHLRRDLLGTPGVESVSLTAFDPLVSQCDYRVRLPDIPELAEQSKPVNCAESDPEYFRTMGVRLLKGRIFNEAEMLGEPKVLLVDDLFVQRYLRGREPLGARVRWGTTADRDHTIIGVVSNVRSLAPGQDPSPTTYRPDFGQRLLESKLLVRTRGPQESVRKRIQDSAKSYDANVVALVRRIEENVETALATSRTVAAFAGAIGVLALVLACCGIYGVVSFAVARRTREVGIRVALGASRGEVLRLLVGQGLRPVVIGLVVGLAAALGLAQLLRALLYGVSPLDPLALPAVIAILTFVAALAAYAPARRAARIDPALALREE